MRQFTTKSRITIGLAALLVSVLCTATLLGVIPDPSAALRHGRSRLCESIAISSSDYMSRGEWSRLEQVLRLMVERNEDILSAGLRRPGGSLVATIGEHETLWQPDRADQSASSHVHVPLHSGAEEWGNLEIRFRDIEPAGIAGWLTSPWFRLIGFVTASSYLLFLFYLGKMLAPLESSPSVPMRVGSDLDSLADEANRPQTDRLPASLLKALPRSGSSSSSQSPQSDEPYNTCTSQPRAHASLRVPQPHATRKPTPLYSTLPTDDIDFREIVEEFAVRLDMKLTAMEQAVQQQDYEELAVLALWLKGSGGTAGFDEFSSPAKILERMAKQHNHAPIPTIIEQLRHLASRIAIEETSV